jgi:hypothetical protein
MNLYRLADGFSSADVQGMSLDPQSQDPEGFQNPRDLVAEPATDGQDPATPGGPSPYNGAEPTGQPVTTDPMWKSPDEPKKPPYSPTPYTGPGPNVDVTTLHNARRTPMEETMTADLWVLASQDAELELSNERLVRAKVAAAGIWPFLAEAKSEREFGHRVALVEPELEDLFPDTGFRDQVTASLRDDYLLLTGVVIEEHGSATLSAEASMAVQDGGAGAREALLATDAQLEAAPSLFDHLAVSEADVPDGGTETANQGNPAFFDSGPEAGPATGNSQGFAQAAPDPWNPMNAQFPMAPSQWTIPPGKDWVERPMEFGKQSAKSAPAIEWVHDNGHAYGFPTGSDDEIAHVRPRKKEEGGGAYAHFRHRGLDTPDDEVKHFSTPSVEMGKGEVERLYRDSRSKKAAADAHPDHATHYRGEGVETGAAGSRNPLYFDAPEGVTNGQDGFAPDMSLPEPDERADWYGAVPPQTGQPAAPTPLYSNAHSGARVTAEKDNHGACAHCNAPVYRQDDTWRHLTGDPGHGVRLHDDHPWVRAQQGNRVMAVRHTAPGGGEHAPYEVREVDGGYAVFNAKGERKNEEPKSESEARQFQKALYSNVPGASESAKAASRKVARWVLGEASSSPDVAGDTSQTQVDPMGAPPTPQSMEPGGAGSVAGPPLTIPNDSVSTHPFAGQNPPQEPAMAGGMGMGAGMGVTALRYVIADTMNRPTAENPLGVESGDEFYLNNWNKPAEQRPRQDAESRRINTPQRPGQPIPVRSSEGEPGGEEDEEERQ